MHRRSALVTCGVLVSLFAGHPDARAQAGPTPVVWHVGSGYVGTLEGGEDLFESGWGLYGGATFHPHAKGTVGLRFDLGGSYFGAEHQVVESGTFPRSLQVDDGYRTITSLSIAAQFDFGGGGRFGWYLLGGLGAYGRYQTMTGTVLIGDISCDPLSQLCIVTGEGTILHETDRLTKAGTNVGLGMTFAAGPKGAIYLEGQYRRMQGSDPAEFVPIVAGYRW